MSESSEAPGTVLSTDDGFVIFEEVIGDGEAKLELLPTPDVTLEAGEGCDGYPLFE